MVDTRLTEEILKLNPRWRYVRTDRNGTRYFEDSTCGRCGGRGVIDCYQYVEGGICFECGGSGVAYKPEIIKVYTPEHDAKLAAQREARAQKREAERLAQAKKDYEANLIKNGFGKEGDEYVIYRVVGDTYSIKEELKALGCKFRPSVGWYADRALEGYETQRMVAADVLEEGVFINWKDKSEVEALWIERQRASAESTSEWQGEIGSRLELYLHIDRVFESEWAVTSWKTRTSYMYLMSDKDGNKYKWSTTCWYKEGDDVHFKATVKDHTEYKSIKQTVLTRCTEVKE